MIFPCMFLAFVHKTLLFFLPSPVEKCEPVLCAYMHGGSRGEAQNNTHSVLLKDLQRPGALTPCRQHHLWLQGECGDLFAGKQLLKCAEEKEEKRGGWVERSVYSILVSTIFWENFLGISSNLVQMFAWSQGGTDYTLVVVVLAGQR